MFGKEDIVVLTSLVIQIFVLSVQSYSLKCPSQVNWKLRAQVLCSSTLKYFCLYNSVIGEYVEGCDGPDWDRKGSKRIYAGDFSRGNCLKKRFQPFIFWTNDSVSDCIFVKSICGEEGQVVYQNSSSKDDRTCRCNYKKSYAFIQKPRNYCHCIPTEEECSCYIKSCPENYTLSSDYRCKRYDSKENTKCIPIIKNNKTFGEKPEFCKDNNYLCASKTTSKLKRSITSVIIISIFSIFLIIAGVLFVVVVLSERLPPLNSYCHKSKTDYGNLTKDKTLFYEGVPQPSTTVDVEQNLEKTQLYEKLHTTSTFDGLTIEEVYFLRIVHLLFRVACPVTRITFNHEIQPNQLSKTLDKNKALLAKLNNRTGTFINDVQWNLLFKGNTVKSGNFDISLMIYLLQTLANINICDFYPLSTDTSTSAMLARIKYIRNETTHNLNVKLTEDQFNKYWDDIGQAVLKMASSHTFAIENDQEDIQLIGRLLSISPININNRKLCTFIDVFEKYPAMILEHFISEYCISKQLPIHAILREEKHRLYHKRLKTVSCCQCTTEFPIYSYSKCIPERHWEALYTVTELDNSFDCKCELKPCIECFAPKRMPTFDIFVATTLILHVPNILKYFISRLCVAGFKNFLIYNKHTIYHCMKKNMCCECNNDSTGKILINEAEWNTLYIKEDALHCKTDSEYCCCQYAVRNLIKYSDVDDTLLSKIFNIAGPLKVLNKIGQDAFFYFLNWTDDDQPLQGVLIELLNIIEDKQLVRTIRSSILSKSNETITNQFEARKWISKHLKQQQATTDHQCQIFVRDEDGLKVKSIDIPEDFPLPHVTKKFNDITPEENNFLLVFSGLTNIVYPVLKKVFDTKCPDPVLHKIWMEFYQSKKQTPAKNNSDDDNKKKKRIHLTESQRKQLFPANGKASRNINLQLMIHILKHISKEEAFSGDVHQLKAVENIRREIVQSSSGVLNETRFLGILNSLQKALLHFGGKLYVEKILQLRHVKRILE